MFVFCGPYAFGHHVGVGCVAVEKLTKMSTVDK